MPETKTYYSTSMVKDAAFWVNALSFIAAVVDLNANIIPAQYKGAIGAFIASANLFVRYFLTTRPMTISEGQPVEVKNIPPNP